MKRDHSECKRWFFRADRYRGDGVVARLVIGFYHPKGGTTGEFTIVWTETYRPPAPQLRVFDDAWSALYGFSDFLAKLAEHDGESLSPEAVAALLKECGVEDMNEEV